MSARSMARKSASSSSTMARTRPPRRATPRKLVEQEKVDFLIGTSGAPQTLAMATAAIEMKVPMVAVSPIAPVPAGEGGPWVVQTPQPTPLLVQGIVDHMKGRNVKTVAFIGFSDAFGDLMYNSLLQAAEKADIKVIANERYAQLRNSVTAQVLRAFAARPDAIMLGGRNARRAARDRAGRAGLQRARSTAITGMISADFLRLAGKAAKASSARPARERRREQLPESNPIRKVRPRISARPIEKANGEAPADTFSPYAFDGWLVFVDAAKRAKATGAPPGHACIPQRAASRRCSRPRMLSGAGHLHLYAGGSAWRRRSRARHGPDRERQIQAVALTTTARAQAWRKLASVHAYGLRGWR